MTSRLFKYGVGALAILGVAGGLGLAASGAIRNRAQVVGLKAIGKLPDIAWSDLPGLIVPGSGFDMETILLTRSGAATFVMPTPMRTDTAAGSKLFAARCSQCHGAQGEGKMGPSLISGSLRHGASDWAMYRVIRDGVPQTAMRPTGLAFQDAWKVVAVLRARERARSATENRDVIARAQPVNDADLIAGDQQENEWLNWSGGFSGRRHRAAPDLTAHSLDRLQLSWAFPLPPDPTASQSSPIAVGNLLIITAAEDVVALNASTGDVVWRYHYQLSSRISVCCTRANRGAAVYGNQVYVGTLDARLLSLDLASGRKLWETAVADPGEGVSITGAPLVAEGKVIVGMSGGEFGVRGFLDAYDAATGKRAWRFHTIPAPGEPGSETWPAKAMTRGGGGTWVTGSFDPERHLLYWGTGNPAPGMAPDVRPGDNLYTCSVVALDIRTGQLRWTYQFTPNDSHDWDAAQTPILVDRSWKGQVRPLIMWVNRNGFFYVLDRATGEFLSGTPFVKQTWNHGFDSSGRPQVAASSAPTPGGTIVYPGASVAANWWPASYSPELNLVFVATWEVGGVFVRGPSLDNYTGYTGGVWVSLGGPRAFLAVEPESGKIRWRSAGSPIVGSKAYVSGTLSLGGNLVLAGAGNEILALDARTGAELWKRNLGAPIQAAPMMFRVNGKPRIAVTAGSMLFVFGLEDSPSAAGGTTQPASARRSGSD